MQQAHKKLERLFMFSEVATCLSFTEAAEKLSISKGYLSAQIKQLEAELQTPLLVRTTRNVRLTRAGDRVFQDFKQVRHSLLAIERNVISEQQEIAGVIRMTAPKQFAQSILMPMCHAFMEQYPNIKFDLDSSYTKFDLIESDFDLAFRATKQPPENLIARHLFDYQYAVVAAPKYLAEHGTPKAIAELSEHNCLTTDWHCHWFFKQPHLKSESKQNEAQVKVGGNMLVNDNFMLRELAVNGKGIARLPTYFVKQAIAKGELVEIFADQRGQGLSLYVMQPQLLYPSARVEKFVQFIRQQLDVFELS